MRLTVDGATLITSSVDGSICVWDVKSTKRKIMRSNIKFAENILISSKYLKSTIYSEQELHWELKHLVKEKADDEIKIIVAHERKLKELSDKHHMYLNRLEKENKVRLA